MSSSAVNRQTLLESVNLLPDDLLLELASFIDYLRYKSTQPVPEENASASFLSSITGLGASGEGNLSDRDEEVLLAKASYIPTLIRCG